MPKKKREPVSPDTLDHTAYNILVHKWNSAKPSTKRSRVEHCKLNGHDMKFTPFSKPESKVRVCTCCLRYEQ